MGLFKSLLGDSSSDGEPMYEGTIQAGGPESIDTTVWTDRELMEFCAEREHDPAWAQILDPYRSAASVVTYFKDIDPDYQPIKQ